MALKRCEHCNEHPARCNAAREPQRYCSNRCGQLAWRKQFREQNGVAYGTQYSRDLKLIQQSEAKSAELDPTISKGLVNGGRATGRAIPGGRYVKGELRSPVSRPI